MLNNRMLAVAAVLVLAVPALGAAAPIVVPPQQEQLVEGHTVFTVIEVVNATTTNETRFAAAVAVLVREYAANNNNVRFPGVLWFNDQYLVNPQSAERDPSSYRYPCGGAVLAVNQDDPDPRVIIASVGVTSDAGTVGNEPGETSDLITGVLYDGDNSQSGVPGEQTDGDGVQYGNDYAWVDGNVNATGGSPTYSVNSDTVLSSQSPLGPTFGVDYQESYLVTDPNDHTWIIDKYVAFHRSGTAGINQVVYQFPVWAVNILGYPVFIPDDGMTSCYPFYDLVDSTMDFADTQGVDTTGARAAYEGLQCGPQTPAGTPKVPYGGPVGTVRDNPCAGYSEPSRWDAAAPAVAAEGYCYGGQAAQNPGEAAPNCDRDRKPLRLYNALLYFDLADLTVYDGTIVNHAATSTDTNGCQVGTEWTCPGYDGADPQSGDDNKEGNSHAFHPASHATHQDTQACPNGFGGPNPTNHAGSSTATPGSATYKGEKADSWGYWEGTPCDYDHTTRQIDVYFSGQGRPFIPLVRSFKFTDFEGSAAPFQDYPSAYGSP